MFFKARLELFDNEVDVKYGFILRLKKLLLNFISQTNINKKEKINKQKIKTKQILRLT